MLESNTDRSYFMIGAVVVAGIIIAGAVFIFDTQIFGETGILTATFNKLSKTATDSMDHIATPINPADKMKDTNTIMGLGSQLKMGFDMLFL